MQAGGGSEPQHAGTVLADVPDRPEDTVRTVAVDREAGRGFGGGIEPIERFVVADPQIPGPVFEDILDNAPCRVVRMGRIATVGFELVAVVPVQRARGVEPQETLIVLNDVADSAGGQAVPAGQMGKADVLAFGYREFHERGFRCAQSGGKLKKATPPSRSVVLAGSSGLVPMIFRSHSSGPAVFHCLFRRLTIPFES